ncbi:uncharacterized protein LOC135814862 [Sycon ciliatum]|uniref:uncharacterized protein LOC135814862 n=1 Tax=Sycon ciliatum TaxID=27933 RepID=UPI0031F6DF9E
MLRLRMVGRALANTSRTWQRTVATSFNVSDEPAELKIFRQSLRKFVDNEVMPNVNEWEEAGACPKLLQRRAAEIGVLGIGMPEQYGGVGGLDVRWHTVVLEEMCRAGSLGLLESLLVHFIALPPLLAAADRGDGQLEVLRKRIIPPIMSGEKRACLAVTEPSGGSDVANLRTKAHVDGDHYVINGEKTFITGGTRADFLTVAVRTGGEGENGVSLVVVDGDTPGLQRTRLPTTGWWPSDTSHLTFTDCRVPRNNLVGEEGQGFPLIMHNFNMERFNLAVAAVCLGEVCLEEAESWARQRYTFGQPLLSRSVIQHRLVDMRTAITSCRAWMTLVAEQMSQGHTDVASICMLKNHSSATLRDVVDGAVHVLGGASYIRGCKTERIFRDMNVLAIGGGSSEIMKELAFRQLERSGQIAK